MGPEELAGATAGASAGTSAIFVLCCIVVDD